MITDESVSLTLGTTVTESQTVTLTYDGEAIQDLSGKAADRFENLELVNLVGNLSPTATMAILYQLTRVDAPFSYTFPTTTFADADDDPLVYTAKLDNDDPLPLWLEFDAVARTFSGTPPDVGRFQIRVTADDRRTGTVSTIFTLDVIADTQDTPTDFTATAGAMQATLTWTAPVHDGGIPFTGYEYRYTTDGYYPFSWTSIPASAPSSPNATSFTVTGLSSGTPYHISTACSQRHGSWRRSDEQCHYPQQRSRGRPRHSRSNIRGGSAVQLHVR